MTDPLAGLPADPLADPASGPDLVVLGDNADVLPRLPDGFFQLVYVDPPFNTGRPT